MIGLRDIHLIAVHGYNSSRNGESSTERLWAPIVSSLQGYHPGAALHRRSFSYDWNGPVTGLVSALLFNGARAKRLALMVEAADAAHSERKVISLFGHSNGCTIIHRALGLMRGVRSPIRVVYINPALDRDIEFPSLANTLWSVLYTPGEIPTTVARYIPFVKWGAMGAEGYTGKDHRVSNVNTGEDSIFPSSGHSDKFSNKSFRYWGAIVADFLT